MISNYLLYKPIDSVLLLLLIVESMTVKCFKHLTSVHTAKVQFPLSDGLNFSVKSCLSTGKAPATLNRIKSIENEWRGGLFFTTLIKVDGKMVSVTSIPFSYLNDC